MTNFKNIAVAVASIVLFSTVTNAQTVKASYAVKYEEPLAVKYMGSEGDYLTFQVTMQAPETGNAFFAIADKNEGVLYSSNFTSKTGVKTIKVEKRDAQVLNFRMVIGKKIFTKSFSVNTNLIETTTVAESDITRL